MPSDPASEPCHAHGRALRILPAQADGTSPLPNCRPAGLDFVDIKADLGISLAPHRPHDPFAVALTDRSRYYALSMPADER